MRIIPAFVAFLILIGVSSIPVLFAEPGVASYGYSDLMSKQQERLWHLGKGLSVGDSFTYKICDPDAILNYSAEIYHYFTKNLEHNGSLCYTVNLEFVNLVSTDENKISGNIWIVQAAIRDDFANETRHSIFHVDSDSYNVRSADTIHPDSVRYAKSLQNTIFSIHKYTAQESKLLQSGISWGEVTEYNDRGQNPDMKVIEELKWDVSSYNYETLQQKIISEQKEFDVFSVGYDVDILDYIDKKDTNNVTNYYLVSSHLPFPVSGQHYNPSYIIEPHKEYEFELLSYLKTDSNKQPQELVNDVITHDLPITETDTIEITLPDDIIPDDVQEDIIQDANVNVIPDDVEIILDNTSTNNDDIIPSNNETKQNDSTLFVVAILFIVLGVAGFVLWKRPSLQWKNKKQNITKTKITFTDKINLEIKTIPQTTFKQNEEMVIK